MSEVKSQGAFDTVISKMGQAEAILRALSCKDCSHDCTRYVCNAAVIDSQCSDCCQCHMETKEVAISDDDSSYSVEIQGCCEARKS